MGQSPSGKLLRGLHQQEQRYQARFVPRRTYAILVPFVPRGIVCGAVSGGLESAVYDPDHLTGPEGYAQKAQVREKRCHACVNRRYEGVFGHSVLICSIGMEWPKRGYCRGFTLDMGADDAERD